MYEYYSYSYEYCNIRVHVADPVIPVWLGQSSDRARV